MKYFINLMVMMTITLITGALLGFDNPQARYICPLVFFGGMLALMLFRK